MQGRMATKASEGAEINRGPSMLRTIGLIILGLVAIVVLSADLEILGFGEHPYVARILAAAAVGLVAYIAPKLDSRS